MSQTKSSKSIAKFTQISILASLFVLIIIQAWKVGFICSEGDEITYWERARFFLGQGGATSYRGNSLVSLGYSLVLLPICAMIENPLRAYKAAVLLNGCFLCAGYLFSVKSARRLFPKENEIFLSLACAFAALCPIFGTSRFYTGPDMIVFFLMWVSVYCILCLQKKYDKHKTIFLTASMILIGFFDIAYIGVLAGILIILWMLVKRERMNETTFLTVILALLLGLAAGNIAERIVLMAFSKELDITYASSIEVFLDGVSAGWENGYVSGLFRALAGKLYAAMVGSLLLICPALWDFARRILRNIKKEKKKYSDEQFMIQSGLIILALIQLVLIALYDNSRTVQTGLTSLDKAGLVLLPIILIGIIQIKNAGNWAADMAGFLLLLCICTFVTANQYQASGTGSFSRYNNGILMLFQNDTQPVSSVYIAACITILLAIILTACVKEATKWNRLNHMLRWSGYLGIMLFCLGSNLLVYRDTVLTDKSNDFINSFAAASMLTEIPEDGRIYYIAGSGGDSKIPKIQALAPEQEIEIVKTADKSEFLLSDEIGNENNVFISGSEEDVVTTLETYFEAFQILYMTRNYAIWGHKNSTVGDAVETSAINRLEMISLDDVKVAELQKLEEDGEDRTRLSKKHTYGKKIILAPGTYHLEVHFKTKDSSVSDVCKLTVKDSDGTITSKIFNKDIFDENGQGVVGIEFTKSDVMRNFRVVLDGTFLHHISVEAIYYRKNNSAYTVGMNKRNTGIVADTILNLDQSVGAKGTVAYVGDIIHDASDLSLAEFEAGLPGYALTVVTKDELTAIDSDYLVAETIPHAYFGAMQDYSIIARGKAYTVLVRNDSLQAQTYQSQNQEFLSNGTVISMSAVNATGDENSGVSLEEGTYGYHVNIRCQTDQLAGDGNASAGTLLLYDGEKLIASKGITNQELMPDASGVAEISIPFTLRVQCKELTCRVEMESAAGISLEPAGIELLAEKYQYGSDEKRLQAFFDLVNAMGDGVRLYVTQSKDYIQGGQYATDYLEEMMPEARIDVLTYTEANALSEDALLLIRSFSDVTMDLLDKYSIIGHGGVYTLWARNDGQLLQRAVSAGAQVYNSGRKLSPESIAAIWGYHLEEDGLTLEKGQYAITVEVKASGLESDDIVEVSLLCDKTEKEIEEEIEELLEDGKTLRQAEKEIDRQKKCGSATVEAGSFAGKDTVIIRVSTNQSTKLANLICETYSWHGCDTEGEILWIEKL